MRNPQEWTDDVSAWMRMGNQRPRRLVCVTDDEKEHEAIREAAGCGMPVRRASDEWEIFPEVFQIVTGDAATLVSGALNRGYGVRPDKWPIRFGLLNNDVAWRGVSTKAMSELSGLRQNRMACRVDECHVFTDKNRIRIDKLFDTDGGHHADVESIVGEPPCKMPPAKDMAVDGPPLWVPLADHLSRTVDVMGSICRGIGCGFDLDLSTAARYHDWAKAHQTFKDAFFADLDPAERAMRDTTAWAKRRPRIQTDKTFFHDLIGGCAMMSSYMPPIPIYLVLSHHGRFRTKIPDVLDAIPAADLGGGMLADGVDVNVKSSAHRKMFLWLYETYGPFLLSYLEALLRVADMRASRFDTVEDITN